MGLFGDSTRRVSANSFRKVRRITEEALQRRFPGGQSFSYLRSDLVDKFHLDRVHGRLYAHAN
jgi:hypothetical protein